MLILSPGEPLLLQEFSCHELQRLEREAKEVLLKNRATGKWAHPAQPLTRNVQQPRTAEVAFIF